MNTVHPKILQRILSVLLDKLTEGQQLRVTEYILALIRKSRGRRPKTRDVIEVLSWALPDFPLLRALLRQEEKNSRARRGICHTDSSQPAAQQLSKSTGSSANGLSLQRTQKKRN